MSAMVANATAGAEAEAVGPTGVPLLDGLLGAGAFTGVSASTVLLYASAATGAYALWEQMRFRMARSARKDGKVVPGPNWVTPFLGGLIEMVMDPYRFWERQKDAANVSSPGYSYNSLFGKMIVTVTDADKCRELMAVNDPTRMLMVLHPSAKTIMGANNLAFLHGDEHKAIRKSFVSLFTRKALSTYAELQDGIIRAHLAKWLQKPEFREVRDDVRDMNQETSQDVFLGPYIQDPEVRRKFSRAYYAMTDGFIAFPICLPGTTVWKARAGRLYIFKILKLAAAGARDFIKAGGEPRCLMDFWAQKCLAEIDEAEAAGLPPPSHTTVHRMADAMIDFLFASQDASTASLVWSLTLMADHPDVLAKVREEQLRVRPDPSACINGEVLGELPYTRQVVKEILRYRAPAPMVPQMAYADYPLTDDYSIPAGTLVFPSINAANMQGFPDAERFDPDRMGPERKEDIIHAKNFLTFGYGPHYCVGKEYAVNQLVIFLSIVSLECDWERRRTPQSDDLKYLPTIFPADSLLSMRPRTATKA